MAEVLALKSMNGFPPLPESPSLEEVAAYVRVLRLRQDVVVANQESLMATLQRIETKLDSLKNVVGWCKTDEHGTLVGEGLCGDLGRLRETVEKRFRRYDDLTKYTLGIITAAGLLGTVFWVAAKAYITNVVEHLVKSGG